LEYFAESPLHGSGEVVVAVAERKTVVRLRQRRKDFRRHAGGIVASEVHARLQPVNSASNMPLARSRSAVAVGGRACLHATNAKEGGNSGNNPAKSTHSGAERFALEQVLGQYYCPIGETQHEIRVAAAPRCTCAGIERRST
jgi:hypothetical protein